MVGRLDEAIVNEASGLAASKTFPGRWYHVNDSGNISGFLWSEQDGANLRFVRLTSPPLVDAEDLAVGPCGDDQGRDCLYIADIGDNGRSRESVTVELIAEAEEFVPPVDRTRRLRLRYPDGRRDAEALAVDPRSGDLYILSKEFAILPSLGSPAQLYRLPAEVWKDSAPDELLELEPFGRLDLPAMAQKRNARLSHVATAMDIRPDGRALLVLTYDHAWEIAWDLADGPPPPTAELDYQPIRLELTLGKESIGWLPDGSGFLQGKEFKPDQEPSVLIRYDCRTPLSQ